MTHHMKLFDEPRPNVPKRCSFVLRFIGNIQRRRRPRRCRNLAGPNGRCVQHQ